MDLMTHLAKFVIKTYRGAENAGVENAGVDSRGIATDELSR